MKSISGATTGLIIPFGLVNTSSPFQNMNSNLMNRCLWTCPGLFKVEILQVFDAFFALMN